MAVPALVPGEQCNVIQSQCGDRFVPAPRVFVSAVKQQQRFLRRLFGQPGAVVQTSAVAQREHVIARLKRGGGRQEFLYICHCDAFSPWICLPSPIRFSSVEPPLPTGTRW